jgi:hypothetical protein
MFHYDAFYFHSNQHINKALAVSRDGKHYYRIHRGEPNMPHGECGEWDSGRDRTQVPFRVGDELWLYFCGMPAGQFSDPDAGDYGDLKAGPPSPRDNEINQELRPWKLGMARLRVDGWGYMRRERDAEAGVFTTIPFEYKGGRLVVNGSGLNGVKVELRAENNSAAVKGFESRSSRFGAEDSVASRVAWSGGEPAPGRYRLRFILTGLDAKVYSFGFEE